MRPSEWNVFHWFLVLGLCGMFLFGLLMELNERHPQLFDTDRWYGYVFCGLAFIAFGFTLLLAFLWMIPTPLGLGGL